MAGDEDSSWFGRLDDSNTSSRPGPSGVHDDRFIALFPQDSWNTRDRVLESVPDATTYRMLPFALFEGDRSLAEQVAALQGVMSVFKAPRGSKTSETLVEGFDRLAEKEFLQRNLEPGEQEVIGGSKGPPPTQPALMPVVNFSVGPVSDAYVSRREDPVNLATLTLADNQLVVVAAGNSGAADVETVSAWAEPDWVLSVGGTADRAGTTLAPKSSRGVAGQPQSGPDVVAYGASGLDETRTGTSYAAPRVTELAMLLAAVVLQVRRIWLTVLGNQPPGIELVGAGFVDVGFDAFGRSYEPVVGLPPAGLDEQACLECFEVASGAGVETNVIGSPQLLRRLLIASARPIPGYAAHEVGAGFLDRDVVLDWLAARNGLDVLGWFTSEPVDADHPAAAELARRHPFDRDSLAGLHSAVVNTWPLWCYDYRTRQLGHQP